MGALLFKNNGLFLGVGRALGRCTRTDLSESHGTIQSLSSQTLWGGTRFFFLTQRRGGTRIFPLSKGGPELFPVG